MPKKAKSPDEELAPDVVDQTAAEVIEEATEAVEASEQSVEAVPEINEGFAQQEPEALVNDSVASESVPETIEDADIVIEEEGPPDDLDDFGAEDSSAPATRRRNPYWAESIINQDRQAARAITRQQTADDLAAAWASVIADYRRGTVFPVQIIGAETLEVPSSDGTSIPVVLATCKIRGFVAHIPLSDLWLDLPNGLKRRENEPIGRYIDRSRTFVDNMLGNDKINVMITSCQRRPNNKEHPYAITASRRRALFNSTRVFFADKDNALTKEGDVVSATIVSVGRNGVYAEVRGFETYIPKHKLTYRFLEDIRDYYRPGDQLMVEIEEIDWGGDGNGIVRHLLGNYEELTERLQDKSLSAAEKESIAAQLKRDRTIVTPKEIRVSARRLEAQELHNQNHRNVRKKGIYRGVVSAIWQPSYKNVPYLRIYLPDVDLVATATAARYSGHTSAPAEGDIVEFKYTEDNNQEPYILYGTVLKRI